MMNLFDKNKYRLSDTEKSAIWRDISLTQTERRRWWLLRVLRLPRLKLAPAFATAVRGRHAGDRDRGIRSGASCAARTAIARYRGTAGGGRQVGEPRR